MCCTFKHWLMSLFWAFTCLGVLLASSPLWFMFFRCLLMLTWSLFIVVDSLGCFVLHTQWKYMCAFSSATIWQTRKENYFRSKKVWWGPIVLTAWTVPMSLRYFICILSNHHTYWSSKAGLHSQWTRGVGLVGFSVETSKIHPLSDDFYLNQPLGLVHLCLVRGIAELWALKAVECIHIFMKV